MLQPIIFNLQPNPTDNFQLSIFSLVRQKSKEYIQTSKPNFPQDFSDDTKIAKRTEIRHFSALIYLFFPSIPRTQHDFLSPNL